MTDAVLAEIVRDAEADPNVLAVVLHGSRGAGQAGPGSDYDVIYVVAREAPPPAHTAADAAVITLHALRITEPSWFTDSLVQGRIVVDRTGGELTELLSRLGAATDVEGPYGAYLNAFVRGKAAARRGDELGARLHAADSVRYLVESLAALEGRRPRFHDRLRGTLGEWEPRLLALVREPTVARQLALFADVRALMESRGVLTHRTWKEEQLS